MSVASRHTRSRLLDRLFDRRPTPRRAVLRCDDQQRNVIPEVCVKTGERTDHAATVRAIQGEHVDGWVIAVGQAAALGLAALRRRPSFPTAVPVAERTWRTWQARLRVAIAVTSAGTALLIIGLVRGIAALIVLGAGMVVLGWLNRVRAWHNAWIGATYRPDRAEITVTRVHSAFDLEAAAIYRRSVLRRR